MANKTYKELNTIGRYWRKKYNEKVYKIPISISGFTCPNIDGTVAKGGCSFCENESFSPNLKDNSKFKLNLKTQSNPKLGSQLLQLQTQFNSTKAKLEKKFKAKKFIVYFQSFTNTYAPLDTLKALYEKALSFDNVIGISIGTRADSITDETLLFLKELSNRPLKIQPTKNNLQPTYEIWIEYGIQTIFDKTLKEINRGEDFSTIEATIIKTKQLGLNVCGHLIFGLPNETPDMMLESVKKTIKLNVDSIKFHPLYVVKNTLLTNEYIKNRFTPIDENKYMNTLIEAIKLLPTNISISRVTAGISDDSLLSPSWCQNKHTQMYNIKKALLQHHLIY